MIIRGFSVSNYESFGSRPMPSGGVNPIFSFLSSKGLDKSDETVFFLHGDNSTGERSIISAMKSLIMFIFNGLHPSSYFLNVDYRQFNFRNDPNCSASFELSFEVDGRHFNYALDMEDNQVKCEILLVDETLIEKESNTERFLYFHRNFHEDPGFLGKTKLATDKLDELISIEYDWRQTEERESNQYNKHQSYLEKILLYYGLDKDLYSSFVNSKFTIDSYSQDIPLDHRIAVACRIYRDNPEVLVKASNFLMCNNKLVKRIRFIFDEDGEGAIDYFCPIILEVYNRVYKRVKFTESSKETQEIFCILASVFKNIQDGGTLIIDNFGEDIKGEVLSRIVEAFLMDEENPKKAKLIFSCDKSKEPILYHKWIKGRKGFKSFRIKKDSDGNSEVITSD